MALHIDKKKREDGCMMTVYIYTAYLFDIIRRSQYVEMFPDVSCCPCQLKQNMVKLNALFRLSVRSVRQGPSSGWTLSECRQHE